MVKAYGQDLQRGNPKGQPASRDAQIYYNKKKYANENKNATSRLMQLCWKAF